MTIVVEGPDGGGKTTLVNMLCEALDTDVEERASTSEHGINMSTLREWVDKNLARGCPGLNDRHPLISEPIYGPLTRGRMADGFHDLEWMSRSLDEFYACEPLIIYCLPPLSVVKTNVQANHPMTTEHMSQVNRNAGAIWHAYCHRASIDLAANTTSLVWDYTQPNADVMLDQIINIARRVNA